MNKAMVKCGVKGNKLLFSSTLNFNFVQFVVPYGVGLPLYQVEIPMVEFGFEVF